jgi:3-oxoacyl-[acyl-carrier-protein] synthase-1
LSTSRVYLHAPGMINALGNDVASIVSKGQALGMGTLQTRRGEAFVGRVMASLDCAPAASLAHYDCRNNRLLLAALAQIRPAIEAARERYGARRIGVVLGTSTSGISAAEAALAQHAATGDLPASFDYRQMEIGTAAPFAAAALGLEGPAFTSRPAGCWIWASATRWWQAGSIRFAN